MKEIVKAYRLLEARDRWRAWAVVGVSILMALFDSLGTLSVMPFLAVLADPDLVARNAWLTWLQDLSGLAGQDFLVFLAGLAFGLLILAALVRSFGFFFVNRVIQSRIYSVGTRLLDSYLRQPYAFFVHRHSGDMAKTLISEIDVIGAQVFQPGAMLIAQSVLLLVLAGLMIAVNPLVAVIAVGLLGTCYVSVYLSIRRLMERSGRRQSEVINARFRLAAEAIGGIKALKLMGYESRYRQRFLQTGIDFGRLRATALSLGTIPRYAIEAVAFGGILVLAVSLMLTYQDSEAGALSHILPLLGFYAFAGYRLMPAVQGIYQALSQLRFGASALDRVSADLALARDLPPLATQEPVPLPFTQRVEVKDMAFRYPQVDGPSLQSLSLTIPAGSTLGIVGPTGAGKTTFVDLFLGLLTPESGGLVVDGVPVTAQNLRNWQADLGYVPQDVFLLDASVAENIALGLTLDEIDMARVREAARMAQILDFVETQMPQGFATSVGERGVRLSGGQRQRIGIARALYRDPGLIVFDEATSALDNLTEQEVVRAIGALTGKKTVLLIAHRISTVKDCDQILVLERGRMVGIGRYEDLYRDNPVFRQLVDARDVT